MALIQKIIKKRKQRGYTVIEVMIVLSVSSLLLAAVVAGYSRQNTKTQFTNAVRDIEVTIQDILNDVSTGYYPASNDFNCIRSGSPAVPFLDESGSAEQGTNQDCIFLGKAVELRNNTFTAYTLVGLKNSTDDEEVLSTSIVDAENRIVDIEGTFATHTLHASIDVQAKALSNSSNLSGFAIVSGFGNAGVGGAGATTTQVSVASIDESYDFNTAAGRVIGTSDLDRDIVLCIKEAGGDRQASITIGVGAQTNIQTMIDGWADQCG
jgi:prepilin-type N-terminal cleavage/methylation domain-containing protein